MGAAMLQYCNSNVAILQCKRVVMIIDMHRTALMLVEQGGRLTRWKITTMQKREVLSQNRGA